MEEKVIGVLELDLRDESDQKTDLLDKIDISSPWRSNGILLGNLQCFREDGTPMVALPNSESPIPAQSTVSLGPEDIGTLVAVAFLNESPIHPLILGPIVEPSPLTVVHQTHTNEERLVLTAERSIELRCGKASIILDHHGKVVIKGARVVSRASRSNKIKGASVQIN